MRPAVYYPSFLSSVTHSIVLSLDLELESTLILLFHHPAVYQYKVAAILSFYLLRELGMLLLLFSTVF